MRAIPPGAGTARLFQPDFLEAAIIVLSRNSAKIVARVVATHGTSIATLFAAFGLQGPGMSSIHAHPGYTGDLSPSTRCSKSCQTSSSMSPGFSSPGCRFAFSLVAAAVTIGVDFFGVGGQETSSMNANANQLLRMDYPVPHGRNKSDAYYC